jgi:hypothetical protein
VTANSLASSGRMESHARIDIMLAKAAKPTSTKALLLALRGLDSRGLTSGASAVSGVVEGVNEGVNEGVP